MSLIKVTNVIKYNHITISEKILLNPNAILCVAPIDLLEKKIMNSQPLTKITCVNKIVFFVEETVEKIEELVNKGGNQ